jgi:hypothetical protein
MTANGRVISTSNLASRGTVIVVEIVDGTWEAGEILSFGSVCSLITSIESIDGPNLPPTCIALVVADAAVASAVTIGAIVECVGNSCATDIFPLIHLPDEWMALAPADRTIFSAELQNELPVGHLLFNKNLTAIARRKGRDDFLFTAVGAPLPLYVVHLTWHKETDVNFPFASGFTDTRDFECNWRR